MRGKRSPSVKWGNSSTDPGEVALSVPVDRKWPRLRQKLCRDSKGKWSGACCALRRDGFPLGELFWQLPSSELAVLRDMAATIFQSQSDSSTWLVAAVLDTATPSPASTPLARFGDSHLEAQCLEAEAIG